MNFIDKVQPPCSNAARSETYLQQQPSDNSNADQSSTGGVEIGPAGEYILSQN